MGKTFPIGEVSNLHASEFHRLPNWWPSWEEGSEETEVRVAFDFNNRTYKFGIGLQVPEAKEVVDCLKSYLLQAS